MTKDLQYVKASVTKIDKDAGTFDVLASTADVDRDQETISPSGWKLDNFLKNPVILWAHNYSDLPIGVATDIKMTDKGLEISGKFASKEANPKAEQVKKLYEEGIQRAVSVGFIPLEREEGNESNITSAELLELSFVPVPANPNALALAKAKGIDTNATYLFDTKDSTPLHETTPADMNREWDADKAVINLKKWAGGPDKDEIDFGKYAFGFAWVDDAEPDNFGSYKLPHHDVDEDLTVVWRGLVAAMAVLLGARGGVDIPEDDRRGVYDHLANHYKAFDREAPEFRSYTLAEFKSAVIEMNDEEATALFFYELGIALGAINEGVTFEEWRKGSHLPPECNVSSPSYDPQKCAELMGDRRILEAEKQDATAIQTLILSKDRFDTLESARTWVDDHDFNSDKVDETEESFRFRQFAPGECQEESFRTIEITEGVNAVICRPEKGKCNIENNVKDVRRLEESTIETLVGGNISDRDGRSNKGGDDVILPREVLEALRRNTLKSYQCNELVLSITKKALTKKRENN